MSKELNENPETVSHKPSMNLRFVRKEGRLILQQMYIPEDWDTDPEIGIVWRDVQIHED